MQADIPAPVSAIAQLMRTYEGAWALCGGWALDAWLGRITREHGDVDVAAFRDDQAAIYRQLNASWGLVAHETDDADHRIPWDGHALAFPSHLHARADAEPERELPLNERDGEAWILRRDPLVTLPVVRFALAGPWDVPTMAPEAIAFYKLAGSRRPRDDQDIEQLLPILSDAQRAWLKVAVGD